MHYFQWNIGDYQSHTGHLEPMEDLAYRRMLEWCYLHEKPLPNDVEKIAKLIRMRTHCECIKDVLLEFFTCTSEGYEHDRVNTEVDAYYAKKEKARNSAKARWDKGSRKKKAKAMRSHSEGNANHKPLTINQLKEKYTKENWEIPEWLNLQAFSEFEFHRKDIRKTLTPLARTKVANCLKGFTADEQQAAVNNTIQNRWAGLFPEKVRTNEANRQSSRNGATSNHAKVCETLQRQISNGG